MEDAEIQTLWQEVRSLRPIVEAGRVEAEKLRRLPDDVVRAYNKLNINRLILPKEFGGLGAEPLLQFDLVEEVASYDGSAGWNFAVASTSGLVAGRLSEDVARRVYAGPEDGVAGSAAPQGKAIPVDGGYRVTGKFAWASAIHQVSWAIGGCFVFEDGKLKLGANNAPIVVAALVPKAEAKILDTWLVGGLKGTGSTEFLLEDVFVPYERALNFAEIAPTHPSPLYALPPSFFGFAISAVPLGIARAATEALKDLAHRKKAPPPRTGLIDQPFVQYVVAKTDAMVNAARLGSRDAFTTVWREVADKGVASLEDRARLRAAMGHAVETSADAVQMCYRAAGGSALFENEGFERALRDVNAAGAHITTQHNMMEDAGRVKLGLPATLPLF